MLVTSTNFSTPAIYTVTYVTIYATPYANSVTTTRNETNVYISTAYGTFLTALNTFIGFPAMQLLGQRK
jgi:hypothetical protein